MFSETCDGVICRFFRKIFKTKNLHGKYSRIRAYATFFRVLHSPGREPRAVEIGSFSAHRSSMRFLYSRSRLSVTRAGVEGCGKWRGGVPFPSRFSLGGILRGLGTRRAIDVLSESVKTLDDCGIPTEAEMKLLRIKISNVEVNQAGKALLHWDPDSPDADAVFGLNYDKIAAFRETHVYALRVVTTLLRQRALKLDPGANVYSRMKRVTSVLTKLMRNSSMQVTTMQDLGGCRAVVEDIGDVLELARQFREIKPRLEDPKEYDYIAKPKPDGYRSMHFVIRFRTSIPGYGDLPSRRIEIQVRSKLQHQWATALETIDLFTGQTLKLGGGLAYWKRFFVLASAIFAQKEKCQCVPGCSNYQETLQESRGLWRGLRIRDQFEGWVTAAQSLIPQDHGSNSMYLIEIDVEKKTTQIKPFSSDSVFSAFTEYREAETRNKPFQGKSAVLVTASSVNQLRRAFPSYYGDTKAFLKEIEQVVTRP